GPGGPGRAGSTTAAIGVGTVRGNHLGGAAQRRRAPASRGSSAARPVIGAAAGRAARMIRRGWRAGRHG
ncbi:hypothetical protein ACMZ5F_31145, partial [Streptomyces rhizosphaericola]|uniref:hypothetical protein n=1 Tax=Streptomyces rhizosphaericola TaxID=2564098 RepID=UPI0039EE0714